MTPYPGRFALSCPERRIGVLTRTVHLLNAVVRRMLAGVKGLDRYPAPTDSGAGAPLRRVTEAA